MITIVPYQSEWPVEFQALAGHLREVLGDKALAIHHIGSTSVPGLQAKDVIDVQITVTSLDQEIVDALLAAGYLLCRHTMDHCPPGIELTDKELRKFLFNGPGRRSNIHIRVKGKFNQRYPLLCRDYLRTHPLAAAAYGRMKQELAKHFPNDMEVYCDIKDPVFDILMAGANAWAEWTGWKLPESDI